MRTTFIISRVLLLGCVLVAVWNGNWFALLGWLAAVIHSERAEMYRGWLRYCGIDDETGEGE